MNSFRMQIRILNGIMLVACMNLLAKKIAKLGDGYYWVEVYRIKCLRTLAQNRYYWKLLEYIEKKTGHTKDELHELLKYKFLSENVDIPIPGGDEKIKFPDSKYLRIKSTRELSTAEFGEYIEKIKRWASFLDLYLPDADEVYK